MIEGKRLFNLPQEKPAFSEWFVTVDISEWLGTEDISAVTFTAICENDGTDASAIVLDPAKNTYTGSYLKPFIQAGQPGYTYRVEMRVTTTQGSKEVFYIRFDVADYYRSINLGVGLDAVLYE